MPGNESTHDQFFVEFRRSVAVPLRPKVTSRVWRFPFVKTILPYVRAFNDRTGDSKSRAEAYQLHSTFPRSLQHYKDQTLVAVDLLPYTSG